MTFSLNFYAHDSCLLWEVINKCNKMSIKDLLVKNLTSKDLDLYEIIYYKYKYFYKYCSNALPAFDSFASTLRWFSNITCITIISEFILYLFWCYPTSALFYVASFSIIIYVAKSTLSHIVIVNYRVITRLQLSFCL